MSKDYAKEFREDLKEFHEMTEKFYQKDINIAAYKRFSGGFGSYAQRGGASSMLRLRFAGGEIRKEQLLFIAESIEKYNISLVHFSTCQSVQFHNLSKAQVCHYRRDGKEGFCFRYRGKGHDELGGGLL